MRPAQIRVYRAKDGWRWHMRAPNGKLVAEGGEAGATVTVVDAPSGARQ